MKRHSEVKKFLLSQHRPRARARLQTSGGYAIASSMSTDDHESVESVMMHKVEMVELTKSPASLIWRKGN